MTLNDTWLYTAGGWSLQCSGSGVFACHPSPPPRYAAASAYDPALGGVVVFGGCRDPLCFQPLNDTWLFAQGVWSNLTAPAPNAANTPPATAGGVMGDDVADGYLVLETTTGATWAFSNGSWSNLTSTTGPSPREGAALFYDAQSGNVVLTGGLTWNASAGGLAFYNDTWTFAGGVWSRLASAASPTAGYANGATFDPLAGVGFDFGPSNRTNCDCVSNATWSWNGTTWTNISGTAGPGPTMTQPTSGVAFDSTDGYSVLLAPVSGNATATQTWVLRDPLQLHGSVSEPVTDLGMSVDFSLSVTGGVGPYVPTFTTSPIGCSPSPTAFHFTRTIACTPSRSGTFALSVTVEGATGLSASLSLPLVVNPDPVVAVTVSPNPVTAGIPVALTASFVGGTRPIHASWTLGDGTTANGTSLVHTYGQSGGYLFALSATDAAGYPLSWNGEVTVNPGPTAQATVDRNRTDVGFPLTFFGTATGGTGPFEYAWTFGDGGTATGNISSHVFQTPDTYAPTLSVTDTDGVTSASSVSVVVVPRPVAVASGNVTNVSLDGSVTFTAAVRGGVGPYAYRWSFADGSQSSSVATTHLFAAVGTFTTQLTVTDALGASASTVLLTTVTSSGSVVGPPSSSGSGGLSVGEVGALGAGLAAAAGAVFLGVRRLRRPPPPMEPEFGDA